jgi:hypothetical protein
VCAVALYAVLPVDIPPPRSTVLGAVRGCFVLLARCWLALAVAVAGCWLLAAGCLLLMLLVLAASVQAASCSFRRLQASHGDANSHARVQGPGGSTPAPKAQQPTTRTSNSNERTCSGSELHIAGCGCFLAWSCWWLVVLLLRVGSVQCRCLVLGVSVKLKPRFFMLAEAACCFVCPMMLIEKTRLPDFECVVH